MRAHREVLPIVRNATGALYLVMTEAASIGSFRVDGDLRLWGADGSWQWSAGPAAVAVVGIGEVGWRAWSAMESESDRRRTNAARVRVIRERAAAFRRHPLGYRP